MDFVQAFVLFGITTALLIVSGDNLSGVLQAADTLSSSSSAESISAYCTMNATQPDGSIDTNAVPQKCRLVATAIPMLLIILPLSLLKDMSSLRCVRVYIYVCVCVCV
jgi:hypothetical protein